MYKKLNYEIGTLQRLGWGKPDSNLKRLEGFKKVKQNLIFNGLCGFQKPDRKIIS